MHILRVRMAGQLVRTLLIGVAFCFIPDDIQVAQVGSASVIGVGLLSLRHEHHAH